MDTTDGIFFSVVLIFGLTLGFCLGQIGNTSTNEIKASCRDNQILILEKSVYHCQPVIVDGKPR